MMKKVSIMHAHFPEFYGFVGRFHTSKRFKGNRKSLRGIQNSITMQFNDKQADLIACLTKTVYSIRIPRLRWRGYEPLGCVK